MPLVLSTEYHLAEDHIVRLISQFVDSIPHEVLYPKHNRMGRLEYSPAMLLKMLIFAYTRRTFSGRRIQQMAEENLPMKWLIGDEFTIPSYRTINRFRTSEAMPELIKAAFMHFRQALVDNHLIDDEAIFIDGTKITADANKYSFVWRRASEKNEAKLDQKLDEFYQTMIQDAVDTAVSEDDQIDRLEAVKNDLDRQIDQLNSEIETEKPQPGGSPKKQRRRKLKHYRHLIESDYLPRKKRYQYNDATFGDRNSFSKTDPDATFMRMKEDPMQNGQLKPGYNLQIGTQNQFTLYYDIFPRPTDQRTLQPFVDQIDFDQTPFRYVVADAGYGSESNYTYLHALGKQPLIPYTMYDKEQSRRYRTDMSKLQNWAYDKESDSYTDNHQIHFSFKRIGTRTDKYGFTRHFKFYEADSYDDPEHYHYSITEMGNQRHISINPVWEAQKQEIRDKLSSDEGAAVFGLRKIEPETVFGHLKARLNFNRLSVRGTRQARCELGIILMAGNMEKLIKKLG